MGLMDGKVVLIFGIANKNSIAWGIAQKLHADQIGAQPAAPFALGGQGGRQLKLVDQPFLDEHVAESLFQRPCHKAPDFCRKVTIFSIS